MMVSIFWPPLKIMTVGMLRMPYSVATPGLSSVLSLNCVRQHGVVGVCMATGHVRLAGCSVGCDDHVGDTDCTATGPTPLWRAVGGGARVPAVLE